LLAEEEAAIAAASSGKTPAKKLTQAELSLRKAEQERENLEAEEEKV